MTPEFLATIQPIVLVGGRSTRFGRDKLREPWGDGVLVQRPIAALRAVFGPRVKLVGQCHPSLPALADGVIDDRHPGAGPIGGIISALLAWRGPVFVLAGDMPEFGAEQVVTIVDAAAKSPEVFAALARSDRVNPCAGMYFPEALPILQRRLQSGEARLHDAVPPAQRIDVAFDEAALRNLNEPKPAREG